MPLVVMCGFPSSGKSTTANKVAEFLRSEHQKTVHIVREEELFRGLKNDILDDSRKEKELRAKLKSEAQRLLNKESVVIIDGLNYIKGYRYEIYCMSKAVPTRQVTIQCDISETQAWEWNSSRPDEEAYKRNVFDNLIQRFEAPDSQNRWDSPYFPVLPNEDLDYSKIYQSLFLIRPPKQNMSTQQNPLSSSNFLSSLEKVTSEIIQTILEAQKEHHDGSNYEVKVPHSTVPVSFSADIPVPNLAQLTRLKRQFINLHKTGSVKGDVGVIFVQYLNSQFGQ